MIETATAPNPTEASASTEASATLLAPASTGAGTPQQAEPQAQPTETETAKPAEAAGGDPEKPAAQAATTVPEKYEFKAPEGTEYDPEILESFSGAAKEAGLSQESAQKLIEKMAPAIAARQVDQIQAIHKEWLSASTSDKEYGGEKLNENLGVAKKALDSFGTPELKALLEETGLGNHPEVIRLLFRTGKAISEDGFVAGRAGKSSTTNPAAVLYDKTTQKS